MNGLKPDYAGKVSFEIIDSRDYDRTRDLWERFNVQVLPTTVVLDGSDRVVLLEVGLAGEASYREKLIKALDEASG